jgi:sugar O-acyltransferase (sialic acid O-acetyltransferase NeuD family)
VGIVIIGGGGHGKVIIDAINCCGEFEISGILDPRLPVGSKVLGYPVLGDDEKLKELGFPGKDSERVAAIGVGSIGDNSIRAHLHAKAIGLGYCLPTITHPTAIISPFSEIGEGSHFLAGAIVNACATVGENCVINTSSIVEHDCEVGDNVFTGPGVVLCGSVTIGRDVFIGANSCITPGITVGDGAFISAHSLIKRDMPRQCH